METLKDLISADRKEVKLLLVLGHTKEDAFNKYLKVYRGQMTEQRFNLIKHFINNYKP